MHKVMILPLAEEDIMNNTDYIAFEKKAPEAALELAIGFRNTIAAEYKILNRPYKMFFHPMGFQFNNLNNCASHSRYFSDELDAQIFYSNKEHTFTSGTICAKT